MAVYHFTLHAYRSWSPAHPRGYTQRGKGYQPSDPAKAEEYDGRAKFPKAIFEYLPDHPGVFWREGSELPSDSHGIIES
jgi:hypothetical protein